MTRTAQGPWNQRAAVGGAPAAVPVLTVSGWHPLGRLKVGDDVVQPGGGLARVKAIHSPGFQPLWEMTVADGTVVRLDPNVRIELDLRGAAHRGRRLMRVSDAAVLLSSQHRVALPRLGPLRYGHDERLPVDPWLLGVLLGDGYLRSHSVHLCNQQPEVHELVRGLLPEGCRMSELKIGQAGTGHVDLLSPCGRQDNPLLNALRVLDLTGRRAWEKHIPAPYLTSNHHSRLALLQGLLDTDGSIDKYGRIEFSSSSRALTMGVLELIHSIGGRATYNIKTGITWTSPRQPDRKSGRDAHRLTGLRLPETVVPFRRPSRRARLRPGRSTRMWNVRSLQPTGVAGHALALQLDDAKASWISGGGVVIRGVPHQLRKGRIVDAAA